MAAQSNREANRMLACVSDFLRATLAHDGRHEHSLADELALLDAYLHIEKARLGERLRLTMKTGPDVLDSVVPYLMLQPLVENAIRHGIAPLSAPGRLDILVERAGARLLVDVQNDGRPPAHAGSGIGLANVRERLRHLYGDDQQFDAGWRTDGRFGVCIALPLRNMRGGRHERIRVVIVDDEPLARLAVKVRLARRDGFELVAEFGDGDSACQGIAALRPDLVFVDVEMPGKTGLEVLAALPPAQRPMAILLTAYDGFALQAFELAALDYLLKPVDDERFDEALDRASRLFPTAARAVPRHRRRRRCAASACASGARTVLVPVAEVERIEADGDYATLHADGKTWLMRERLHNLAMRLDPRQFQRVHRSSIVRLDMIAELRSLTNRDALLRLRDGSCAARQPLLYARSGGGTPPPRAKAE